MTRKNEELDGLSRFVYPSYIIVCVTYSFDSIFCFCHPVYIFRSSAISHIYQHQIFCTAHSVGAISPPPLPQSHSLNILEI